MKQKLLIPASDTTKDSAIQSVIDGVNALLLKWCGYDLAATSRTDFFRDVPRLGRIQTKYRPVDSLQGVNIRAPGDSVWFPMTADLWDPDRGEIILVPEFSGWPYFETPPKFSRWRLGDFSLLNVSYTTKIPDDIQDLQDAAAALTAYWYTNQTANVKEMQVVRSTREVYLPDAVPKWIKAQFVRHVRRRTRVVG